MKYSSPPLRDLLAGQYVLGTLPRRVRARFEGLLEYDADLRRQVHEWEARLMPLAAQAPAVLPPQRVWRAVRARLFSGAEGEGMRHRLSWWRSVSAFAGAAALVLGTLLALGEPASEPVGKVGILNDARSQPAMLVTWPPQNKPAHHHVRVKMLSQIPVPAGKTLALWMLPSADGEPVALGVIGNERIQTLPISDKVSQALPASWGVGVSVEAAGTSTADRPSGPMIMSGPCVGLN
jgi:anti-sigma-K factor RskA